MNTERRCRWCGRRFEVVVGPGRPREFCRRSCRQRDYEARQRSSELGLSEGELVMARGELDAFHDLLYVLEAAIEDVDRELAADPSPEAYAEAVAWLLDAARPLVQRRLGSSS